MSKINPYIKSLFVEIVLKIVHLAVSLDCILYGPCLLEFTAEL
jgi:hypothetical protein